MDDTIDDNKNGLLSLNSIKKDIENSYSYSEHNYKHYNEMMIFIFKTALSDDDRNTLAILGKPQIEFPILEAYINRIRGEFIRHKPKMDVHAAEGLTIGKVTDEYLMLLKVTQAHLNEVFFQADAEGFSYDVFTDCLGGGIGVGKVGTDYVNEKSFDQKIVVSRVLDPTMCGFDPLAKQSHKGDGRYCFELFPMSEEEFAIEFGAEKAKTFNFTRAVGGFNWSYKNNDAKIVLVAEYYCKVEKPVTLVRVAPNEITKEVMPIAEYNKIIKNWNSIEQPPVILEKRKSTVTRIDLYRVCQNEILEHTETFYAMLPLVSFAGNKIMIRNTEGGQLEELTKSYAANAKGIQQLMNYAGQTVGQELEDMPQYKVMIPLEGIPKAYEKIYQNQQIPSNIVYHQFNPNNPGERLDPPQAFPRIPTPPLVYDTFTNSNATAQTILGSYDGLMGINDKQISGVAIQQGALQSNAAANPYLMGYIRGIQRIAEIIIHLMPLIYTTPRSIPVRLANGKRDYQIINAPYPKEDKQAKMQQKAQQGGMGENMEVEGEEDAETQEMENAIMFNYDPHDISVRVEPGVNAAVQKQVAFEMLTQAMNASPTFAEFINRQGMPVLLDNLELQGIEGLKEQVEEFQAQMEQERQQAAQQGSDADKIAQAEINKAQIEAEVARERNQLQAATDSAKIATERQRVENDTLELQLKAAEMDAKLRMEGERTAAEDAKTAVEATLKMVEMHAEMNKPQGE